MEKLTYRQAYDKIIEAYFKDEIKPYEAEFCFCGTLTSGKSLWCETFREDYKTTVFPYTPREYAKMEAALLKKLGAERMGRKPGDWFQGDGLTECDEGYEEKLFSGMCAALEVLKEIHRDRGENVDELPALSKRVLNDNRSVATTSQ